MFELIFGIPIALVGLYTLIWIVTLPFKAIEWKNGRDTDFLPNPISLGKSMWNSFADNGWVAKKK